MAGQRRYFNVDDVAKLIEKLERSVSIRRAQSELGVKRDRLLALIDSGELDSFGFGTSWHRYVLRKDLERFMPNEV